MRTISSRSIWSAAAAAPSPTTRVGAAISRLTMSGRGRPRCSALERLARSAASAASASARSRLAVSCASSSRGSSASSSSPSGSSGITILYSLAGAGRPCS
eukprot:5948121-Pleurochrysis_carterae.AAC.1